MYQRICVLMNEYGVKLHVLLYFCIEIKSQYKDKHFVFILVNEKQFYQIYIEQIHLMKSVRFVYETVSLCIDMIVCP